MNQADRQGTSILAPAGGWQIPAWAAAAGFATLLLEVVWMRRLAVVTGSSAVAVGLALAVFMLGMGLGASLGGRVVADAQSAARQLRRWSLLAAGSAVPFTLLGEWAAAPFAHVAVLLPTGWPVDVWRVVMALLLLLLPCILLGALAPGCLALVQARSGSAWRQQVARVYAWNMLGSLCGAATGGFWAIETLGLRGASILAGMVLVLPVLWWREAARPGAGASGSQPAAVATPEPTRVADGVPRAAVLVFLFVSGAVAFACEVLWTRTLVLFLDSTVYSFSTMLLCVLGLGALGSALVARAERWLRRPLWWFALLQMLAALWVAAAVSWQVVFSGQIAFLLGQLGQSAATTTLVRLLVAAEVIGVPALCLGAAFPLGVRLAGGAASGKDVCGHPWSAAIAGNVAGALLASFVLLDGLGVNRGLVLVSALQLSVCGWGALVWCGVRVWTVAALTAATALCFLGAANRALAMGPAILDSVVFRLAGEQRRILLFNDEGRDGTTTVHQNSRGERVISVNGVTVAGTDKRLRSIQKNLGHLPMLMRAGCRSVYLVGWGAGGASYSCSLYQPQTIVCAELTRGVAAAASLFAEVNGRVDCAPNFRLLIQDGRQQLLASAPTYDVISSDAIHPKYAGNGALYTCDYYRLCRERLTAAGILVQWQPIYSLSARDFRTILCSFQAVFPECSLWYVNTYGHPFAILMGVKGGPFRIPVGNLLARLQEPRIRADLEEIRLGSVAEILDCFAMGPEAIRSLAAGAPLNTDDRPVLEFSAGRAVQRDSSWLEVLNWIAAHRETVEPYLDWSGVPADTATALRQSLIAATAGTTHLIKGQAALIGGHLEDAEAAFRLALRANPADRDAASSLAEVWLQRAARARAAGDTATALRLFAEAVACDPAEAGLRLDLAELQLAAGDPAAALASAKATLAGAPGHAAAWRLAAQACVALEDAAQAEASASRALELNPLDPEAAIILAAQQLARGDAAAAEASARRATTLQPRDSNAWMLLAHALLSQGRDDEAGEAMDEANRLSQTLNLP